VAVLGAEDAEVGAEDDGDSGAISFADAGDALGVAIVDELAGEQGGSVGGAALFHEGDGGVIERAVLDGVGAVADDHVEERGAADDVDGDFFVELMGGADDGFDFVLGFEHFDFGIESRRPALAEFNDVGAAGDFFADDFGAFGNAGACAATGDVLFEVSPDAPAGGVVVSAGDGDLRFAGKDAWAGDVAFVDGVAQIVDGAGGIAEIADGGEAVEEESFYAGKHVEDDLSGAAHVGVDEDGFDGLGEVEDAGDVGVHVDEAGHDPRVFEVDDGVAGDEAVLDGSDFAVFDDDGLIGGGRLAGFGDEMAGVDDGGLWGRGRGRSLGGGKG